MESFELTIRPLRGEDGEALLWHLQTVGEETHQLSHGPNEISRDPAKQRAWIKSYIRQSNSLMIGAFINDRLRGVGTITGYPTNKTAHRGEVSLSVQKAWWNKGIGSAIMRSLIEEAAHATTLEVLELWVLKENTIATALYERFGFTTIGEYQRFFTVRGVHYDAYLMHRFV